tara:strand:+ start:2998 stop:3420 length:423 start_codon:yes stop_codon:yes gene_type:complete
MKLNKSSIMVHFVDSSIFVDRKFSFSESLILYLKSLQLTYKNIASLLNRNERTIWTIYSRAMKKASLPSKKKRIKSTLLIPISIFEDRSLSIMEILVEYMKEKRKLRYHEIASLLNRNDRTIWTIYQRTIKKRKERKENN